MKRLAAIAVLLAAVPALAQQPAKAPNGRQPLINITRGSSATPGGVALLTLAEDSLSRAKAAAERGDTRAIERELQPVSGDVDSGAFVRALTAIVANAYMAAFSKAISATDFNRIQVCAAGLADAAQLSPPPLDRLEKGADANGDGAVGWFLQECGLDQLRRMIAQAAGAAGL